MRSGILVILLLLSSCGYRFGSGCLSEHYRTIEVPFIQNDTDGTFTQSLVHELARAGDFAYVNHGGELILNVELLDFDDRHIGFRYDRKKERNTTDTLIPIETRLTVEAILSLVDSRTCCCVLGPFRVLASVEFDHDYYESREAANIFSLGQLNDIDTAREIALRPLGRALAEKIVAVIHASF
ncbi:MAG: LptE family protein [Chlamydiia bacterium]|nr:LptE family protein [Chlamydiia bacterium]